MKKVLIALVVVLVLLAGGIYFVFSNLDSLVETAIETAGSRTLGTDVQVDSVSLDLLAGSASIYGFSIANPAGFTDETLASFEELSVVIDVQNLSADNIHIFSIVSRSPHVFYENRDDRTNTDTITERLGGQEEGAAGEASGSQPTIRVDSVLIENIRGTLQDDRLPSAVDVSLGDINLSNLNGKPDELAEQIMAPVLTQVGAAAAQALVRSVTELLQNSEELQSRVEEGRQQLEEAAGNALNRVGNLFNRGGDDDEEAN